MKKNFIEELFSNPMKERAIEYMVKEIKSGRSFSEVLEDPYVKNRIETDKILADPKISEEVLNKIKLLLGD